MAANNSDINQISYNNECSITNRHDIITHLNNFSHEVDRYIHTLPGIILNVPTANVIQASINLNWYIECLKNSILNAMLKEGINSKGDNTANHTLHDYHKTSSPGSLRREYPPSQPFTNSITSNVTQQDNFGPIRASVCRPTIQQVTPKTNRRAFNIEDSIRPIRTMSNQSFSGIFSHLNKDSENASQMSSATNETKSSLPRPFI